MNGLEGNLWRRFLGMLASVWRFAVRSLPWLADQLGRLLFLTVSALSIRLAVLFLDRNEKANGTQAAALLTVGLVALLLAIGGPAFIRRITKLGPQGLELRAETRESIQLILRVPRPIQRAFEGPAVYDELSEEQQWAYEFGTDLILHLEHLAWSPSEASKADLERYRELVLNVGQLAIINKDYEKALYLLEELEPLKDKTADEYLALGDACRLVWFRHKPARDYRQQAKKYLEGAAKLDPNRPVTLWTLSWVYDELGYFGLAIASAERAVNIDQNYAPWAYWNMAVSLLKMTENNEDAAFSKLELIPKGPWWKELYEDPELEQLRTYPYVDRFEDLYTKGKDP